MCDISGLSFHFMSFLFPKIHLKKLCVCVGAVYVNQVTWDKASKGSSESYQHVDVL